MSVDMHRSKVEYEKAIYELKLNKTNSTKRRQKTNKEFKEEENGRTIRIIGTICNKIVTILYSR
jgi:hypothetical protein